MDNGDQWRTGMVLARTTPGVARRGMAWQGPTEMEMPGDANSHSNLKHENHPIRQHILNDLHNMNGARTDNNTKAQLAHDFNQFYLKITSKQMDQIGCYRILEEIGEGAFGKVYLANHLLLNIPVVLKAGLIDDPNIVREIYYHKKLKHKNIVKLYEVIKTETHLWLVMEYCQGNELFYYIYENRRIEFAQCQNLFWQIIQAIKYVHSLNLAHRDLKLENILLADKKKSIVKLTDFGFVREFNPAKRMFLQTICGTTVYMAPEVIKNEKYNGFATDIWSLGVILYTMLYGQMPFDEDDELKTKFKIINEEPAYSDAIGYTANTIIKKMLLKNPNLRPNLNEILNSEFLIDVTNKFPSNSRRSSAQDCESIMSINQHFNSGLPPFQSKFVKSLLKNFKKADIKIDKLQKDVMSEEMNSLTAFYELALTKEFMKKRKKYYRNRRRKAKRSLSRSKQKVKSVLSMSEDGSQPLERIMSSLSLNSRTQSQSQSQSHQEPRSSFNQSRTSLSGGRRSLDQRSTRGNMSRNGSGAGENYILQSKNSTPPFNRTVSFFTNDSENSSSINSALSSMGDKRKKNNKLMSKLQFWKKREEAYKTEGANGAKNSTDISSMSTGSPNHEKTSNNQTTSSNETKDEYSDLTLNSPSPKTVKEDESQTLMNLQQMKANGIVKEPVKDSMEGTVTPTVFNTTPTITDDTGNSLNLARQNDSSSRLRTRPSSMVSQMSQMSHLSQLSTMMSESELEMLESDSMDEFEEEELYESSSMNTSANDIVNTRISSSTPSRTSASKRPSYRRQVSSDISIASVSTSTTRHPSTTNPSSSHQGPLHQKKSSLSQVSSNSSDESSDIISPINSSIARHHPPRGKLRAFTGSPTNTASPDGTSYSPNNFEHGPSPVEATTESTEPSLVVPVPVSAYQDNPNSIFQVSVPRSSSPPMPTKFKNLNNKKPAQVSMQSQLEKPNEVSSMYEPKFIINEENEEDSL